MPPNFTHSDWDIDADTGHALHYRAKDGWLIVHAFAVTASGVVDVVGFHVEPLSASTQDEVADRVQALNENWPIIDRPEALTSRRLRVSASGGASLAEARRQLRSLIGAGLVEQPRRLDRVDTELARLVLRYAELLADDHAGARRRLAAEVGVGVDAIKSRLRQARLQGLWITSTPGKPGEPSQLAFDITDQEDE